jgi:uncharacterized protein
LKEKILVTGSNGMIASALCTKLLSLGYGVNTLSRQAVYGVANNYVWDLQKGSIDLAAFENVSTIVHLAGAGIADARWLPARKKEILDSRVLGTKLLLQNTNWPKNKIKTLITASATGYYGYSEPGQVFTEASQKGRGFLADVCSLWEAEAAKITQLGARNITLRLGTVLCGRGGALPQIAQPIKYCLGAPLGTGQQHISWIDIDDLCNFIVYSIENERVDGVYNLVTDQPVSNMVLGKTIAKVLKRPYWPVPIPKFVLQLLLGQMAEIVTEPVAVINQRIKQETDFAYQYNNLELCLKKELLGVL